MLHEMTIRKFSPLGLHYMYALIDLECKYGGYDSNGCATRNRDKLKEHWFSVAQECGMADDTDYWRKSYMAVLRRAGFLFE